MLICSEIKCPWWSSRSGNYGCQRWAMSCACPLNRLLTGHIRSNEYGLYADADNLSPEQLQGLKRENDRFCQEDTKYQYDRKFFAENPDWVSEKTFVPGDIQA